VPFAGAWQPLMNEHFATIGDVHRLTDALPDGVDQHATADGRGQSVAESRARLARLLGRDVEDASDADWLAVARFLAERQLRSLHDAAAQVLSRTPLPEDAPVVAAGIGDFLARALAGRLGRRVVAFAELLPVAPEAAAWASRAAPAGGGGDAGCDRHGGGALRSGGKHSSRDWRRACLPTPGHPRPCAWDPFACSEHDRFGFWRFTVGEEWIPGTRLG
jgi:hypothetical protein